MTKPTPEEQLHIDIRVQATINDVLPKLRALFEIDGEESTALFHGIRKLEQWKEEVDKRVAHGGPYT